MEDGIYLATYVLSGTPVGAAIVTYKSNTVNGGDFGYTIRGDLKTDGTNFTGKVKVEQWDPTKQSIFPGITDYYLNISGKDSGSNTGETLQGVLEGDATKSVGLVLKKLGSAA